MLEVIGYSLVVLVAVILMAIFPLSEFARGMSTNPSAHKASTGGCFASLIGLALFVWFFWEMLG